MIRKHFIFALLLIVLICSSILVYLSGASANGSTFTLELVPPSEWDAWSPKRNTVLTFTANVIGDTTQITSTKYVFTLRDVSDYTGFCMNAGTQAGDKKDIYFRQSDQPANTENSNLTYTVSGSNGETLTVTCKAATSSITFYVFVDDYGAHGILDGVVYLNDKQNADGTEADNTPSNNTEANYSISIPLDNNGNDIADGWKNDKTHVVEGREGYDPWEDKEAGPNDNTKHGDGFTVFEEYRGFWIKGKHQDIEPLIKKDLFIFSEFANEGYGYASNLPNVFERRLIDRGNMASNTRRMNRYTCGDGKRYKPAPGVFRNPQSAVEVINASASDNDAIKNSHPGVQGVVTPTVTVPYLVQYCRVYPHRIEADLKWIDEHPTLNNYYNNYYTKDVKQTIAHEIGHCIGLYHATETLQQQHHSERHGHSIMQNTPIATHWDDGTELTEDEQREDYAEIVRKLDQNAYPYSEKIHKTQYNLVASGDRGRNFAANPMRNENKPQWSPPSNDGTGSNPGNGGTNPNGGGSNPGNGGTNPGNGGTNPGNGGTTNPPPPPTDLLVSAGDGQVSLSWTAPSDTSITDYEYRYRQSGTLTWAIGHQQEAPTQVKMLQG